MKKKIIVAVLIFCMFVAGAVSFYAVKRPADWYLLRQRIASVFVRADLRHVSFTKENCTEETLADLAEQGTLVDQALMLINSEYPIAEGTDFPLGEYKTSGVMMNTAMLSDYASLSKAVGEKTGDKLYVMSSYRTAQEQQALYEEDPVTAVPPGMSEHQTGLALDVYVYMFAGEGFLKSPAGQYVNSDCWRFGFVIRYPEGKRDVTNVPFEPWHIRYVGIPHAEIIAKNGWCLEEYIDALSVGEFYGYGDYVISRQKGPAFVIPNTLRVLSISPDNTGNYILTAEPKKS